MPGLDSNVVVHKLAVSEGIKSIKHPQWCFHPKLTIQINAKLDKLIMDNFSHEGQYPTLVANITLIWKKNGKL